MAIFSLRDPADFKKAFRLGKKIESPYFKTASVKNNLSYSRFAFIVPLKTAKSSVLRNRLRRRAREWIRKETEVQGRGLDMVLYIKKQAADCPRSVFYQELRYVVEKNSN